ncbi:MAG: transporter related protein [Bryobacterales bacterium]|nr:transporter related protein [Bryobacterales bacterium]
MSIPIRCEDVSKRFRGVQALDRFSLEVPEGAVYGLLGPNGAGKSTAIKTLMNVIRADNGRVEIFGVPSQVLSPREFAKIGYVSENQQLPDWMTVGYFMAYMKPFYPAWDDARAEQLLREFDLPLDRQIRNLSRGMWMKVALASSLAYRPRLLLLDEPFSGLDPVVRDDLVQGILESADETTILVSSHDLAEIESFSSHIGYMDQGRLRFSEEMTALTARFREIEVSVDGQDTIVFDWPTQWLRREVSATLIRFVDSQFDPEQTPGEIHQRFRRVTNIAANPMPLRAIFLALARNPTIV